LLTNAYNYKTEGQMFLAGIITFILIFIQPNYKTNTDEVMSLFLNHCSVY